MDIDFCSNLSTVFTVALVLVVVSDTTTFRLIIPLSLNSIPVFNCLRVKDLLNNIILVQIDGKALRATHTYQVLFLPSVQYTFKGKFELSPNKSRARLLIGFRYPFDLDLCGMPRSCMEAMMSGTEGVSALPLYGRVSVCSSCV